MHGINAEQKELCISGSNKKSVGKEDNRETTVSGVCVCVGVEAGKKPQTGILSKFKA